MKKESKTDVWMPWYIDDYQRDTQHLTTLEHGAYRLLIDACWCRGGNLPNNDADLARICRLFPQEWQEIRPRIEPFFNTDNGEWTHNRVTRELKKARKCAEDKKLRTEETRRVLQQKRESVTDTVTDSVTGTVTGVPTPTPTPTPTPLTNSFGTEGSSERKSSDWQAKTLTQKVESILGRDELAKRPDWIRRTEERPIWIAEIMDVMHADLLEGHIIKNRGAYAETLWKKSH